MYVFDYLMNSVKLSSHHDKLPPKLNFDDIKRELAKQVPHTIKTTTVAPRKEDDLDETTLVDYVQ